MTADRPMDTGTEGGRLALEFDLPHSPEKVWRALTDPTLLAEWLLPVLDLPLGLSPGTAFRFKTEPPPGSGWDGIVNCRCIELQANKKLSWRWVVGEIDTVVTFTLEATRNGAGTQLSIVQSGFKPEQKREFGGARYGWKMMSGKLVELLERLS